MYNIKCTNNLGLFIIHRIKVSFSSFLLIGVGLAYAPTALYFPNGVQADTTATYRDANENIPRRVTYVPIWDHSNKPLFDAPDCAVKVANL